MTPFDQRMAEFRARFLLRASEDARRIDEALDAGDLAALREICHGLSGNAGMFGFADVGASAESVERAVDAGTGETEIRALAANLRSDLDDLADER